MELSEPARKLRSWRILWLFPVVGAPASPGMLALPIAPVAIWADGASPPIARGTAVVPTPVSFAHEFCRGIARPALNACLPFVQLNVSPYVHILVRSW